jgi:SpoVK/Ycf46/Vps4 family AAA+-type ATPase
LDGLESSRFADADEITSRSGLHEELRERWPLSWGFLGVEKRGEKMEAILDSAQEARESLIELIEEEIYRAERRLVLGEDEIVEEDYRLVEKENMSRRHKLVRGITESVKAAHPGLLPIMPSSKVLVGMDETLTRLERYIDSALYSREKLSGLFPGSIPRGLILHGPTGVGKTESVKVVIQRLVDRGRKIDLYLVPTSSFLSSGLGESDKNIEKLFQEDLQSLLDGKTGVVVLLDELDGIARVRSNISNPLDRVLNLLFILIDQIDHEDKLIIVGTTNRYELLDPAIIRRLGIAMIQMPLPDKHAREKLWKHFLSGLESHELLINIDYTRLASMSEGLAGGEIENIVCAIIIENSDDIISGKELSGNQIETTLAALYDKIQTSPAV